VIIRNPNSNFKDTKVVIRNPNSNFKDTKVVIRNPNSNFKDTKVVIRNLNSKDIQHNDKKEKVEWWSTKPLHRKIKIDQHESHKNPMVMSCSTEGSAVLLQEYVIDSLKPLMYNTCSTLIYQNIKIRWSNIVHKGNKQYNV
jgi:hypothetical protein